MKTVFFISSWKNKHTKGGISDLMDQLAIYSKNIDFKIELVCLFGSLPPRGIYLNAEIIQNLHHPKNESFIHKIFFWMASLFNILIFCLKNYKKMRQKHIVSCNPATTFILPLFFNNVFVWENVGFFSRHKGFDFIRLIMMRLTGVRVISPTKEEQSYFVKKWYLPKCFFIPDWYNPKTLIKSNKVPANPRHIKMLAAGALHNRKGFDRLLKAVNLVSRNSLDAFSIDIFGDGPEKNELENLKEKYNLSNVRFMGHDENLSEKYKLYDVFLLTSRYEGFPLVMVSALAAGIPTIAFDCKTGPRDIIKNGENGYLVPNGDLKLFALSIERFLCDYVTFFNNMGVISKSVENYSIENAVRKLEVLIKVDEKK
ncbi:glycosyltransferase [Emcibacteraceae bacterium]|nr:glycosyltransferase [Emcibacteraceae bacterium]